jgi:hypothetical protein
MIYMKLTPFERQIALGTLASMRAFLQDSFGALSEDERRASGPAGAFSPVEHVWHLADVEREGFAVRIGRLRSEIAPMLPDFDGARAAAERNYRSLPFSEGLRAFEAARLANIEMFRGLAPLDWTRSGTQEGIGAVSLCDMPELMRQHDESHKAEIREWRRFRGRAAT